MLTQLNKPEHTALKGLSEEGRGRSKPRYVFGLSGATLFTRVGYDQLGVG